MGLITIIGLLILILILDALRNHISFHMKHDCSPRRKKKKRHNQEKKQEIQDKENPKTSGIIQIMILRLKRINIPNMDL